MQFFKPQKDRNPVVSHCTDRPMAHQQDCKTERHQAEVRHLRRHEEWQQQGGAAARQEVMGTPEAFLDGR